VLAARARGEAAGEELHAQDTEDEQDEGGDAQHVDHLRRYREMPGDIRRYREI